MSDRHFELLAQALERPELAGEYPTNEERMANAPSLIRKLARIFKTESAEHWIGLLEEVGLPVGRVRIGGFGGVPGLRAALADALTPVEAWRRLRRDSGTGFLFESVTGGVQVARFSFLAATPSRILRLYRDRVEEEGAKGRHRLPGPPLESFRTALEEVQGVRTELPFAGHPTIGSAHAALESGFVKNKPKLRQECGAGLIELSNIGQCSAQ